MLYTRVYDLICYYQIIVLPVPVTKHIVIPSTLKQTPRVWHTTVMLLRRLHTAASNGMRPMVYAHLHVYTISPFICMMTNAQAYVGWTGKTY